MKRIFILLLCLCMLLVGCGPTDNGKETESASEQQSTDTQPTVEDITAVSGGKALLKICYTDYLNRTHAENLQKQLASKTGVTFDIVTNVNKLDGSKAIFVGFVDGRDEIADIFQSNISYSGYGAVFADGNVYLCGYTETAINKAVSVFASSLKNSYIDKNAEGGTSVKFDKSMAVCQNPKYDISSPALLGVSLGDYSVVISSSENKFLKQVVSNIIVKELGEQSGAYVAVVESAAEARKRVITVATDAGLDMFGYSVKSNGEKIEIKVGGLLAAYAAFADIKGMLTKDTSAGISLAANATDTFLASAKLSEGTALRVMSANVLGTDTKEDGQCSNALRGAIMGEYILALNPDSIGLQEYYGTVKQNVDAKLSGKYSLVSFSGVGVPMVSTAYRTDKYTLEASKAISLKVDGGQDYYFTWVALKDKTTGELYVHGNLHLDYRGDSQRVKQAELVNAELANVRAAYPEAIVAVSGDYNCMWGNAVITKIADGLSMNDAALAAPEGKADNQHMSYGKNVCVFSEIKTGKYDAIDHILVSEDTASVKLHKIVHDTFICHASDHYPVVVDIAKK